MGAAAHKSVLITGANTGLGKELARQLALRDDFDTIYLACRNPVKAQAAQQDLSARTRTLDLRGSDHGHVRPRLGTPRDPSD